MSPKKSKAKARPKKARPKMKTAARVRARTGAKKKAGGKKAVKARGARKAVKKKTARKAAKKKTARRAVKKKTARRAVKKKTARKAVKKKTARKAVKKKTAGKAAKKKTARKAAKKGRATKKAPRKVAAKAAKKATARPRSAPAAKGVALAPVVVKSAPAPAETTKPAKGRAKGRGRRRSSRRTIIRRGPDGEILAPGDLLLPGGAKGEEEIQYLFRGCMAAEHPAEEEAISEVLAKRGIPEGPGERDELQRTLSWAQERFGGGDVEPIIPIRSNLRRTFPGVVDRARQRRREIGAFLRGLDMGHTETSHMDAHGEASLQSLMEWAARLENLVENLAETPETNQAHYTQFHRVLDQLEATTEALVIDVEQTLRRLRDRLEH
jgi:hypothetical protein